MSASLVVHSKFTISKVDPRLFGGFIEHLGRAVYEGIYEPGHPSADPNGFRQDVVKLIEELDMPVTRYPGGNFVSGYNWEDGVGPKEERPARLDLAWGTTERNAFGTNEFIAWCKLANTTPMIAVNLGTRGPEAARNLVEYCNHPGGTYWSDLRRKHGYEQPHGVKLWCLGNEMDGHWQIGAKTAEEYGRAACETAKVMKWVDPSIELVVCGSSAPTMATAASWEAMVLEHTYDLVEYLSIHRYYGNRWDQTPGFLAMSEEMDRYIKDIVAACDYVGARKKSKKKIMLSFDEWNVWFHSNGDEAKSEQWSEVRPILEDIYTMEDALLVGGMLITLLNNADRVKIGCIAQSVNVIAPIMTRKGGGAWRQTTFYPFAYTSRYGRGTVLRVAGELPTYDAVFGQRGEENLNGIPILAKAMVYNEEAGEIAIFVVNRNLSGFTALELDLGDFEGKTVVESLTLHHSDLKAVNSEHDEAVAPKRLEGCNLSGSRLDVLLPAASWNMIRVRVEKD